MEFYKADADGIICLDDVELQRLQLADILLGCLEANGVDNWEWFGEALEMYKEAEKNFLANRGLNNGKKY